MKNSTLLRFHRVLHERNYEGEQGGYINILTLVQITFFVTRLHFNWQKSIILISSLSSFLNTVYKPLEFAIFVDLFLKTIAPYFRIVSVWITQGRLEDWRNEFVFAANPKFCGKRVKRKYNEEETTLVQITDI